MRRVYPRVDYTPAPWTVAGTVDRCYAWAAELKHSHLKGGIAFHRRFRFPYVFSWAPLLVGDTAEVVSSSATSCTVELIRHNYRQDSIGVPSKLHVAHTHTPVL